MTISSFYLGPRKLRFDVVAHAICAPRLANQETLKGNQGDTGVEAK